MHSLGEAVGGSSWTVWDAEELNLRSLVVQIVELESTPANTVMM